MVTEDTPPPTVLLVDDDIDVLAANARFLRINHFEVIVANSAEKALEYLETAVLLSPKMPEPYTPYCPSFFSPALRACRMWLMQ